MRNNLKLKFPEVPLCSDSIPGFITDAEGVKLVGTFEPRLPGLCLTLSRTMEQNKGESRSLCEMKALHPFRNLASSIKTLHVLSAFMLSPPSGPAEYFAPHLGFFASSSQASERIHFSSLLQIKHPSFTESVLPHPATAVCRARSHARTHAGRQAGRLPLILPSLPLPFNSLSARCDWEYWVERAGDLHAPAQVTGGGAAASLVR